METIIGAGMWVMNAVTAVITHAITSPMSFFMWLAIVVLVMAVLYMVFPIISAGKSQRTPDHHSELYFTAFPSSTRVAFPRLHDPPSLYLTLVVPAYNEQERLPSMMDDMLSYLKERQRDNFAFTWEIIIVDDGSRDQTCRVAQAYVEQEGVDRVRLLKLHHNHGKGGAVRKGMMRGRGQYLLMVDADGATLASELGELESRLLRVVKERGDGHGIAVGSRAHIEEEAVANRAWYRNVLMYGFHFLVNVLCGGHGVKDTQCGFKLFTRRTALILFTTQHVERWAFDVELLFVAAHLNIHIVEIAVNWTEIDGSHLSILGSTFQMLRDLILIRACYLLGFWVIEGPTEDIPGASTVWRSQRDAIDRGRNARRRR